MRGKNRLKKPLILGYGMEIASGARHHLLEVKSNFYLLVLESKPSFLSVY
jgi:hypothetical protein